MNKYQEYIMKDLNYKIKPFDKEFNAEIKTLKNKFIIQQNENYNINKYKLFIYSEYFSKVQYYKNNKWTEVKEKRHEKNINSYEIDIDFKSKVTKIKFHFNNNVASPLSYNIAYEKADKKAYDDKIKAKKKAEIEEKVRVKQKEDEKAVNLLITYGASIINVLFKPLNQTYSYSEIELYYVTRIGMQFMAKYRPKDGFCFHSINELAYGKYSIKLLQYNSKNEVIFESSFKKVLLTKPKY